MTDRIREVVSPQDTESVPAPVTLAPSQDTMALELAAARAEVEGLREYCARAAHLMDEMSKQLRVFAGTR